MAFSDQAMDENISAEELDFTEVLECLNEAEVGGEAA